MRTAVITDTETTGKLTPDHRIIEASFRICNLDTGEELENILMRFNPERNIEAKAQAKHGISIEELKKEPLFKDRAKEIIKILSEATVVVAHNGISFDFPFFIQELERVGEIVPNFQVFDTMVQGTFATDLGKSPSLYELCWSLDVDVDPEKQHKGDYDTLILRDAFFNGLKYGWFKLEGLE